MFPISTSKHCINFRRFHYRVVQPAINTRQYGYRQHPARVWKSIVFREPFHAGRTVERFSTFPRFITRENPRFSACNPCAGLQFSSTGSKIRLEYICYLVLFIHKRKMLVQLGYMAKTTVFRRMTWVQLDFFTCYSMQFINDL